GQHTSGPLTIAKIQWIGLPTKVDSGGAISVFIIAKGLGPDRGPHRRPNDRRRRLEGRKRVRHALLGCIAKGLVGEGLRCSRSSVLAHIRHVVDDNFRGLERDGLRRKRYNTAR